MNGTDCTCDLVDITELRGPKFIRGFSRGCKVHPVTEYERKVMEEQAAWDAAVEAAMRAAREAP